MVEIFLSLNPNFPANIAEHLSWGGLQDTWAFELKKQSSILDGNGNNVWEQNYANSNQSERKYSNVSKGTKCVN